MPPKRRSNTEMSTGYETLLSSVSELLQRGRQNAAKSVNAVLTTTYWLVGGVSWSLNSAVRSGQFTALNY